MSSERTPASKRMRDLLRLVRREIVDPEIARRSGAVVGVEQAGAVRD